MGEIKYSVTLLSDNSNNILNDESVAKFKKEQSLRNIKTMGSEKLSDLSKLDFGAIFVPQKLIKVVIIIPLQGRFRTMEKFMERYENEVIKNSKQLKKLNIEGNIY